MSFTVGKDEDYKTVLKMGDDIVSTLTMNEDATVQLIKLLAATLSNYHIEIYEYESEKSVDHT